MNCPNCKIEIELSWKRYAKSPFSRYRCPECSTKFKFRRPLTYYIWILFTFLSAFGLIKIVQSLKDLCNLSDTLYHCILIGLFFVWAVIYWIFDRDIESRLPTKSCKK